MRTYLGAVRKIEEIIHDLVREVIIAVRKNEQFSPTLPYSRQEHWESVVLLEIQVKILSRLLLEISMYVNVIDRVSHVLEYRFERHREIAASHACLFSGISCHLYRMLSKCHPDYQTIADNKQ